MARKASRNNRGGNEVTARLGAKQHADSGRLIVAVLNVQTVHQVFPIALAKAWTQMLRVMMKMKLHLEIHLLELR